MFFSHQRISQGAVRISLEKQLEPMGPSASRERSLPVFLRKPITTCDFQAGGLDRMLLPHSGSAHWSWSHDLFKLISVD